MTGVTHVELSSILLINMLFFCGFTSGREDHKEVLQAAKVLHLTAMLEQAGSSIGAYLRGARFRPIPVRCRSP